MGVGAKTAKPLWQVAEDLEVTIVTNMVVRKVYMCIASMLTCLVQAGEANESEIFRDMSRPVASNERWNFQDCLVWRKFIDDFIFSSAVASTLRNLAVLYRRQGKTVAAEFVEKVARVQVSTVESTNNRRLTHINYCRSTRMWPKWLQLQRLWPLPHICRLVGSVTAVRLSQKLKKMWDIHRRHR